MKNATLKLCVTTILALTISLGIGQTACYAEEQTTVAVEESSEVSTEITVETNDEEYIDMWSIPEEARTVENFGPGFTNGVPKSKVPDIASTESIPVEEVETTAEEVVTEPVVEVRTLTTMAMEEPQQEISIQEAQPTQTNRWGITLSQEEKAVLAQIVALESGNQSDVGQQAVVEVVFNRMNRGGWGNGCIGVLSQRGQFTTWKFRNRAKVTAREYKNIDAVLNGETNILPFKTVYFSRGRQNNRVQCRIGDHVFCNE